MSQTHQTEFDLTNSVIPNEEKKVLAVIVAYKGNHWLKESLPMLRHPNVVVYLRDNACDDSVRRLAQKALGNQVVYDGGENLGFGRGNNRGLAFAVKHGFEWVFLLNQDAKIPADALISWISEIKLGSDRAIHCPIQMNWNWQGANYNFQHRYAPGWEHHSEPFEVDFVNAAAWLISRDTLSTIGGFNPVFFMYGEDRDYVQRLTKRGGKVLVHPTVRVYHESTASKKRMDLRWIAQNKVFKDEVSNYFNLQSRIKPPNRGYFWRFLKRMLNRSFGQLVISGVLFPVEIEVYGKVRKKSKEFMALKRQLRHQQIPFLSPLIEGAEEVQ